MTEKFLTDRLENTLSDIKHVFNLGLLDRQDELVRQLDRVAVKAVRASNAIAQREVPFGGQSWMKTHYPEIDAE